MNKHFLFIFFALLAYNAANALEPVRVAILTTSGANVEVNVELYDYGINTSLHTLSLGTLTANSSGIISFVVDGGTPAWSGISSSSVNSNVVLNVKTGVGQTLYAQYRLDKLMILQAQTGSGSAMANGAGAFASIGGKTIANNSNDDFIFGDDDFNHNYSKEYKFFFNKSKGAFRAGAIDGDYWDDTSNLGDYSFATGMNTKANGIYSIAMGRLSVASGESSISIGRSTQSTGEFALSTGAFSNASGKYSTATGRSTTASGESTTAMGQSSIASGDYSTAIGYTAKSNGAYSTAIGYNTIANGDYSIALGYFNDNTVTDELLAIGNGASDATRSNALEVYKNGDVWNSGFIKNKVTATTDNTELAAALTSVINHSGTADVTTSNLPVATEGTFLYVLCTNAINYFLGQAVTADEIVTCVRIGAVWYRAK